MAHDGQDLGLGNVILPDLLTLTGATIAPVEAVLDAAKARVRETVSVDGRVSARAVEDNQTAAHGLAWLATYVESLRQMHGWAERLTAEGTFGEVEQLILQIAFGEYLAQIMGGIQMNQGE
ncbi:MAG: acyl-CoA dehydrogenase, partial [Methylocystaceae bacterium]|nr:acyl-CoA dehydrogenase [Methylocystaceae bacterium]